MLAPCHGTMARPHYTDDTFGRLHPQPLVAGLIRSTPEDFIVIEHLPFELYGEGEHAYVEIEKRNANSGWVSHQLAEFAGIRDVDVGFAGRKDRHALTRQWFSLYLPGRPDPDWSKLDIEGVKLLSANRHTSKLRRGDIRSNEFRIIVRHDPLSDSSASDLLVRLEAVATHGVPNYFGSQRFGRDGENLERADRFLRLREKAPRNKGMLISAARSWLFNGYLWYRMQSADSLAEELGPLIGKSRDPQPGEERFDDIEQAWAEGIRRHGARVDQRALMVVPGDMSWEFDAKQTTLHFSLPAGSFATSVLRELFLVEDVSIRRAGDV
ncbi:MAG: tRNA pseudouridine(13) synthase TruD [Pseudomonadales bacterium]|nr:tRNA pseudouridine(13) synthase TruD [Pseudomonadales bacterium]